MTTVAKQATMTYRDALREGLRDALRRDERVFLMGEDVGPYGGAFGVSRGLLAEFGPERIRDTPLDSGCSAGRAFAGRAFAGRAFAGRAFALADRAAPRRVPARRP